MDCHFKELLKDPEFAFSYIEKLETAHAKDVEAAFQRGLNASSEGKSRHPVYDARNGGLVGYAE